MDCVVAPPGVHELPVAELDVNTTEPPEQNVVGPFAEIVGVGTLITVAVTAVRVVETQLVPLNLDSA